MRCPSSIIANIYSTHMRQRCATMPSTCALRGISSIAAAWMSMSDNGRTTSHSPISLRLRCESVAELSGSTRYRRHYGDNVQCSRFSVIMGCNKSGGSAWCSMTMLGQEVRTRRAVVPRSNAAAYRRTVQPFPWLFLSTLSRFALGLGASAGLDNAKTRL